MWNLRYETDEHVYETETEPWRQTRWVVAKKEEVVEEMEWKLELADVRFYI